MSDTKMTAKWDSSLGGPPSTGPDIRAEDNRTFKSVILSLAFLAAGTVGPAVGMHYAFAKAEPANDPQTATYEAKGCDASQIKVAQNKDKTQTVTMPQACLPR